MPMQSALVNTKGSYRDLTALMAAEGNSPGAYGGAASLGGAGGGLGSKLGRRLGSEASSDNMPRVTRLIIVSNHLPVRVKRDNGAWKFEWDEDALVAQAKEGIPQDPPLDIMYVGSLPVDIGVDEQESIAMELKRLYNCCPVYIDKDIKEKYYKGFCKQQLWPLFHYILPVSPSSTGRFDSDLWQAYVKANKCFADKVVEESSSDCDFVWIHDYHLLVLPSLLRKRFNRIRAGVFLHSPFPSSEIFRTFPKREELLRSLLNADLIGFHTFDYARHFLSCCSRMLGLEHETSRGSITLDYYGRAVGIKIMPTGVNPARYLDGFTWDDFKWRRGELVAQFAGCTVLAGVDDMDAFKGIELKLQAFERLLDRNPEYRGKLVLVQVTHPPRGSGKDIAELHSFITGLVDTINKRYGRPTGANPYMPVHYLERHVPLHERMAYYSVADCAVVTATRDGMNLVPYEYVVCRQGPYAAPDQAPRDSMLVVSEFVGCSPSLSGALRVNPWSVDAVADGLHAALRMPLEHRRMRHEKHWRYVSQHTVGYWAGSYISELMRVTRNHVSMKCYGLGLGLDTFRMVALDANFRRLEEHSVATAYANSGSRCFFLDYDGTLTCSSGGGCSAGGVSTGSIQPHRDSHMLAPDEAVLAVLRTLAADRCNHVVLFSSRTKGELEEWFSSVPNLGLVAENGFYVRHCASPAHAWDSREAHTDFSWKKIALPILQQYQESTDGSSIEVKESALVWHYKDADPDFGSWQAKELLDHLEGVLSNKPVEIVGSSTAGWVEVKPQGCSKGQTVERLLAHMYNTSSSNAAAAVSGGASSGAPGGAAAPAADGAATGSTATSGSNGVASQAQAQQQQEAVPAGQDAAAAAAAAGSPAGHATGAATTTPTTSGVAHGLPPAGLLRGVATGSGPSAPKARAGSAACPTTNAAGGPDFVLCIGDDRSDEDMFTAIEAMRSSPRMMTCEVYAVTVGQKPSRAPFYLNEPSEVLHLLAKLAGVTLPPAGSSGSSTGSGAGVVTFHS